MHALPHPANRALLWIALGLLFALGAILGYRQIMSPDIGFHLSTARWIVENGSFPATDMLTYTVTDHAYIDLQWLFQLLIYGMHQLSGPAMIVIATTGLTLAFGALLLFRTWRRDRCIPLSSVLLLLLFFLGNYWEPRPHLLSWLWGSLVLLVLEEHARGSRRGLPLLPVVMVAWVNSHSLFVLGLVIMGTYVLCNLRMRSMFDMSLLIWSLVAAAACLINPYHVKGLLFPLIQFRDIQGASDFKSTLTGIMEFTSPFTFDEYIVDGRFIFFQPRLYWQIFTVLAAAGLIGGWRKSRLPELILYAGFFYIFWRANKNFGYFVMVCFPMVATGLDRLGARVTAALARTTTSRRRPAVWLGGWSVVCLILMAMTWTGMLYDMAWTPHHRGAGFNASLLPVGACEFINRNGIEGRLLNSWDHGGYIAWATQQKVFIYSHGEIIGPQFYQQYIEARQPDGFPDALEKWQPTVVIVPFQNTPFWLYHLNQSNRWRMVYADEHTAIFLHASVAPDVPALPKPQPDVDYAAFDWESAESIIRRAVAAKPAGLLDWLRGSRAYPGRETTLSAFHLLTGELDACIGIGLEGLQRTPFLVPELMLNLGHAFEVRRRYELADLCFEAFLRFDNDPAIAREIHAVRRSRR